MPVRSLTLKLEHKARAIVWTVDLQPLAIEPEPLALGQALQDCGRMVMDVAPPEWAEGGGATKDALAV